MAGTADTLGAALSSALGDKIKSLTIAFREVTIVVAADQMIETFTALRDRPELAFDMLIDVCGVDYRDFGGAIWEGPRFAAVYHLLSLPNNRRVRARVFAADNEFPVLPSMVALWPSANWFEREAFDLFGIVFSGHPDLRRLLTDYGFVGHPFRKDFPLSGNVEMRYDPEQGRVIYQPVTIEPREITPRIIRESHYGERE
ncbi:MAG TPA: NADH-quinone oxidoreductase subunit C [Casimicrobiaceae bacterium]|nr:NADH-quinone oxidoreductase subunit C [Casimicrobiaceae bacterium]